MLLRRASLSIRTPIKKFSKEIKEYASRHNQMDEFHKKEIHIVNSHSKKFLYFGIFISITLPPMIYVMKIFKMEVELSLITSNKNLPLMMIWTAFMGLEEGSVTYPEKMIYCSNSCLEGLAQWGE